MCDSHLAAAELFGLLSSFWQPPDERFWINLNDGTLDKEISTFAQQAGFTPLQSNADRFRQDLLPLKTLQLFYLRCFVGIGQQTALPVESVYKKWTTDPTARLSIAGSTGYLLGDSALHAQYLLNHYQLQIPSDYRMMPDHLLLLLELLSFLLENRPSEESHLFLNQHFDWLDSFGNAMNELPIEETDNCKARHFYQLALQTLQQTVHCQMEKYDPTHQLVK